jgi:hypothetical protein
MTQALPSYARTVKITAGDFRNKAHNHVVLTEPGIWTVQFGIAAGVDIVPNPVAKVQWNVDGNSVTRQLNILDGASLTGLADSVSVDIFDETDYLYETGGFEYDVTTLISPGPRASSANPPTYFPRNGAVDSYPGRFVLAAAATTDIVIPRDAGLTSVHITVSVNGAPAILTEADVAVNFESFAGVTLKQWDPRFIEWVPIPSAAHTLELVNSSLSELVFGVTFGVDG